MALESEKRRLQRKEQRRFYGMQLRGLRKDAGLTLKEVADFIDQVSPQFVGACERGERPIPTKERVEFPCLGLDDLLLPSVKQAWLDLVNDPREIAAVKALRGSA